MLAQNEKALRYEVEQEQKLPLNEALLLARYHLRLLDWWVLLLMLLGFGAALLLVWVGLQSGDPAGGRDASTLSLFALEPGAALFAGFLGSALVVNDRMLEVTMATRSGALALAIWRGMLSLPSLMLCCIAFLIVSLALGISYGSQDAVFLLLLWLVPILTTAMLGLFGSLLTGNAALGMVLAAAPVGASLFMYDAFLSLPALKPFLITYTYSSFISAGAIDFSHWWLNRLVLFGIALLLGAGSFLLLQREERLLRDSR